MSSFSTCLSYLSVLGLLFGSVKGCVELSGIGDGANDIYTVGQLKNSSVPFNRIFFSSNPGFDRVYGNHDDLLETPIQFRALIVSSIQNYNVMSAYEETAIEFWARDSVSDARRRCQPDELDADEVELFAIHKDIALAYSFLYIYIYRKQSTSDDFIDVFESWGLDANLCDNTDCSDITTPWGLAYTIANEIETFSQTDGWNADGSLNRDYNKIPFSDFRGDDTRYVPVNTPWELSTTDRWQPLLESDELGFLYHQEHVVPHIGYTGKSYIYSNNEICEREGSEEPNYDYEYEMETTLSNLANLTDEMKIEIEMFDGKGRSLFPINGAISRGLGINERSFAWYVIDVIQKLTLYEATIAVWKEKVDYDKVRPPSIIHELLGETLVTSYAGVDTNGATYGTQTFPASNWEPYIRTMPHAEYPSGSSCVCEAWANALIEYYGGDNFTELIGSSVVINRPPFSSTYEPATTPGQPVSFEYNSLSQVSQRCGETRIEGGMHFSTSVPAGASLCRQIGPDVTQFVNKISNGIVPDFVVDFNDNTIVERDCSSESSSSESSESSSSSDSSSSESSSSSSD